MRVAIGCDHRGLGLKLTIIEAVTSAGHDYEDLGAYTREPVDYPDVARRVAQAVAEGRFERGILVCSTGIGMSISANKINGVRAALAFDAFTARRARQHNDANILCLGADWSSGLIPEIVSIFLATEFEGGRHQRRVDKIRELEG